MDNQVGRAAIPEVHRWPLWRKLNELHVAALRGEWETAERILATLPAIDNPQIGQQVIGVHYDILVFSIGAGKRALQFVTKLIQTLPHESLKETDERRVNVLHVAATVGNTGAAKLLMNGGPKDLVHKRQMPDLIHAVDSNGNYPVHLAAKFSHRDMLKDLMTKTYWDRNNNLNHNAHEQQRLLLLLVYVIEAQFFDIALQLVNDYPWLAITKFEQENTTALYHLAGTVVVYRKKYGILYQMRENFLHIFSPLKKMIYGGYMNSREQARELLNKLCDNMKSLSPEEPRDIYTDAILKASAYRNEAVVEVILKAFPQAIKCVKPNSGKTILDLAIENRSVLVFRLIYQSGGYKHINLERRDDKGNNLLHLAAKLPDPHIIGRISGPAIQMQREVQWYSAVRELVTPYCKRQENNDNKTPYMVFKETHSRLKSEGEKWMKDTANSCCIVAVLIITLMFAAAITVPGGDSERGLPNFEGDKAFAVFVVANVISIFTSIISLIAFLSTFTSGFLESSFLYLRPTELILGFGTLYTSIASMTVAFIATIFLVLGKKTWWTLVLMTIVAFLVHAIFWYRQLPLLKEWIRITRHGILGKKHKDPIF